MDETIRDLTSRVALLEKAVRILISRMDDLPVVTIKKSERARNRSDCAFLEAYDFILNPVGLENLDDV